MQGSFQDQFLVHRREGEPCGVCGTSIVKTVVAGRGTYVCEGCQAPPRASRSLRRRELVQASAVGCLLDLLVAAEQLPVDDDLGERHHAGRLSEQHAPGGVLWRG